ncbi:hypothetical protein AAA799E16_02015, partial [Marine Group I thaumarchaeote SCGC AAA799-E16]
MCQTKTKKMKSIKKSSDLERQ